MSNQYSRAIGVIIRSSRRPEFRTALLALPSAIWHHVKRIFGGAEAWTELVTNPDGSGPTVAFGSHSYVTEQEFDKGKDLKPELNAQFGDDFAAFATTSPGNPNAPSFWEAAAGLPTPLFRKVES